MSSPSQSTQTFISTPMAYKVNLIKIYGRLKRRRWIQYGWIYLMLKPVISWGSWYTSKLQEVQVKEWTHVYWFILVASWLIFAKVTFAKPHLLSHLVLPKSATRSFTDVQLRNYQARTKLQQLEETNTAWLKYLHGEIPKGKKKSENDLKKVWEEPVPVQPQKKERSEKSSEQYGSS